MYKTVFMKAMLAIVILIGMSFSVFSAQQEAAAQKQVSARPLPISTPPSERSLVVILADMMYKNSLDEAFKRDYKLDLKRSIPIIQDRA